MSFRDSFRSRPALLAGPGGLMAGTALTLTAASASPLVALAAAGGLAIAVAVTLFPVAGFLLTAAVIPVERIGRLTSDASMYTVSLMRIVGLLALASFLAHALVRKWKLHFGAAFFVYAAYCALGALTIFYTSDRLGAARGASATIGNLLFFFLVINVARSWRLAEGAVVAWLVVTALIGAYTIYDWHLGRSVAEQEIGMTGERLSTVFEDKSEWEALGKSVARATGPTSHAAVYGINLVMTLPFFVYFFRTRRRRLWKAAAAGGGLIAAYNIVLTNTRATLLLAGVVIALCLARRLLKLTLAQLLPVAFAGAALLAFIPGAVYERVFDLSNYTYQRSGTYRIRLEYWNAGLAIAEEHWLTGIGLGNKNTIPRYLKGYGPEQTSVHNDYLQTFIEVGLIGWLCFFGFVGLIFWRSVRAAARWRRGEAGAQYWFLIACQIAMIAVLLDGLQVDVFHFPLKGWWLVAGLSCVMYRIAPAGRGAPESVDALKE